MGVGIFFCFNARVITMPFTFSHPAIVLPLRRIFRNRVSFLALVIGSIAPDFEYFIRLRVHSDCSHTPLGLLLFNIPLGILLLLTYLFIVQKPTLNAAPNFIRRRIPVTPTNWTDLIRSSPLLILSVAIGAFSHLLWDAFTHEQAFFVEKIAWLRTEHVLFGHSIAGYSIAQHSSTVLGGLLIGIYFFQQSEIPQSPPRSPSYYVPIFLLVTGCFMVVRFCFVSEIQFGLIVISTISAVLFGVIATSLLQTFSQKRH